MERFLPYSITHIDLSRQKKIIPPNLSEKGSYVVFWWKEIALGDFYIEPGQKLTENDYHIKIVNAILPAIEAYANKLDFDCDLRKFLLVNKVSTWNIKMEAIFEPFIIKKIPESAPVSVIICTHNRAHLLYQCLSSLKKSVCLPQEIIVIDNAPDNNSTREVVNQFPDAKYVIEDRIGLDIARNTGISKATNAIVAFIDDDVEIHPLWVYRVWETFQDPSIAAMTGLVFALELETEPQFIFEKYWSFNRGYIDKIYGWAYFSSSSPTGPPVWEIGAGASMAFRKSLFEKIGYFDELLDGIAGCNGDSEMWFRILAKGNKIQYNPRAIAYHKHRKDIKELKKQVFNYLRGFTASILWQNKKEPAVGYKRNLYLMIVFYTIMLVKGFPKYNARYKTIWVEIKGVISGISFFYKKENHSLFSIKK